MTKAELIERIARARDLPPDLTKKDIALILGIAFEELATYFARTKVTRVSSPRFTFPHFGTFTKKRRSARRGVHPRTLEPIEIEAFDTVDFKASKELRESMNAGDSGQSKSSRRAKTSSSASKRGTRTATAKARKTRRAAAAAVARTSVNGGRRRLTPRDEDAELDAMIDDEELFARGPQTVRPGDKPSDKSSAMPNGRTAQAAAALPAARMQRVETAEDIDTPPLRRSRTSSR
ncbi:MAG: HU family DNA-binding protein [Nannocystaceae bacterium]|nr:HU family DNA-binding protein [Nannocystaceae bacterium]